MTEEQKATADVSNESIDDKPMVVAEVKEEDAKTAAAEEKPAEAAPSAAETAPPAEQPAETKPEEVKPVEATPEVAKPAEAAPAVEAKAEVTPVKEAVKPAEVAAPLEEPMKTEFLDESGEGVKAEPSTEEDGKPAPENPPVSLRNVKIARIPKEVFEFMVKDETEEGTVRINVTQLRYFVQEELWKLAKYVNGSVWENCDFPVLDMLVPENAQKHLTIQTFNTMKIKDEEKRLGIEGEKLKKFDAQAYQKMNDAHKKKAWADLNRKFVMKDNIISRPGAPPTGAKDTLSPKKKVVKAPPKNVSQIQPAVPVEGVPKPGPGKAVPAAQNGTNNKSDSARKRPQVAAAAVESPVPVKKTKPQENAKSQGQTPKSQGQQKNFPKKDNNNTQARSSWGGGGNQRNNNNGAQRYGGNRFDAAQPWSNPSSIGYSAVARFPAFREPAPVPAPVPATMGYTGRFDLVERERALVERERRLLAAETQIGSTGFSSSTYGTTGGDYRTTYDNYTNSAFGGSTGTTGTGYSSTAYGGTYGSGSTGNYNSNNYGTTSSTYGSFLSTYGGAMDNNNQAGANRRRSGRR